MIQLLKPGLLGRSCSRLNHNVIYDGIQARAIATQYAQVHTPVELPPKEFNADGSAKKYRLNQYFYDHGYTYERWYLQPVGVFHTVYRGEFPQEVHPLWAKMGEYPISLNVVVLFISMTIVSLLLLNARSIGVKPKRYTIEWREAEKERARAENANPCTRYLDRRRKERGPHWIMEDYLPFHLQFWYMKNHHDTELLRERAAIEKMSEVKMALKAAEAPGTADDEEEEEEEGEA